MVERKMIAESEVIDLEKFDEEYHQYRQITVLELAAALASTMTRIPENWRALATVEGGYGSDGGRSDSLEVCWRREETDEEVETRVASGEQRRKRQIAADLQRLAELLQKYPGVKR